MPGFCTSTLVKNVVLPVVAPPLPPRWDLLTEHRLTVSSVLPPGQLVGLRAPSHYK